MVQPAGSLSHIDPANSYFLTQVLGVRFLPRNQVVAEDLGHPFLAKPLLFVHDEPMGPEDLKMVERIALKIGLNPGEWALLQGDISDKGFSWEGAFYSFEDLSELVEQSGTFILSLGITRYQNSHMQWPHPAVLHENPELKVKIWNEFLAKAPKTLVERQKKK